MRLKLRLFIVSLIVGMGLVKGQNLEYGVGVDTNYMMIGDQQHLTFRVRSDVPVQVVFPLLKDTVTAGVEIISGPVRDSLQGKDGKWLIEEKYVITAFDTGVGINKFLHFIIFFVYICSAVSGKDYQFIFCMFFQFLSLSDSKVSNPPNPPKELMESKLFSS